MYQFCHVDSDDDGQCPELLFPGEGEVTDAALVMLRKKMNGKYTLFKVKMNETRISFDVKTHQRNFRKVDIIQSKNAMKSINKKCGLLNAKQTKVRPCAWLYDVTTPY